MTEERISVTLTGPAKVDRKWHKPGAVVEVTSTVAGQLELAGVIAPLGDGVTVADLAPGAPGFDAAVQALAMELAAAQVAVAVSEALALQTSDLAAAQGRIEELSIENLQLRAENVALKSGADTPVTNEAASANAKPVEQVADKPAPKKQATAKG